MSTQYPTQASAPHGEADWFDDALDAPLPDAPSWYQRNSGSLPKSRNGMGDAQRRSELPRSVAEEPEGLVSRFRTLLGK